jgi:hypothetical protein
METGWVCGRGYCWRRIVQLNGIRPTMEQKKLLQALLDGATIRSGIGQGGPKGYYTSHDNKAVHPNTVKSMMACGWIVQLPALSGSYTISAGGVEVLEKGHTSLGIARMKTRAARNGRS